MRSELVIKKTPIVIIRNFVILEVFASFLYSLAAILANYQQIYGELNFTKIVPYELAKFVFKVLAEVLMLGFVFLWWYFETYTFHKNMIVIEKGIFYKKRKTIPLEGPVSITCHLSPLSRILRYGTIVLQSPSLDQPISLTAVPNPELYLKAIKDQLNTIPAGDELNGDLDVLALLKNREHEQLEFKTTFRWDIRENKVNRTLEHAAMKTIAAFLNSEGGHLVIGVGDSGEVVGIEYDYATLRRQDADGFEAHFTNMFREAIGAEHRRFVKLGFGRAEGKEICAVRVMPSTKPAYVRFDNGESFYIRTGNTSTPLQMSQATAYIQSRWG